ncbi:MAG: glutathione S-transferase family protein [Gammaproteobacteria bacterium]|nr:MAG: glutathione S-transferase family protein [Gammaproteobacteria bacterium]
MNRGRSLMMKLHSFFITPNNRKVEAFIKHYDLPVEIHQVSFKDQEHKSPAFLKMNPMGKVPVLEDGDFYLPESNAILTYLARKFPETDSLPTDIRGRAQADRWLHWQSCHLMPAMGELKQAEDKDFDILVPLFQVLDGQLAGRDFMLDKLSVVDFAIGAYLMTKMARGLDYSPYPNLAAWRDRVMRLDGFVKTHVKLPPAA